MAPLKSKDGSVLIGDAVGSWLDGLITLKIHLSIHQQTDEYVINGLPQKEILTKMVTDSTFNEVKSTFKKVIIRKLLLQFIHLISVYGMVILRTG